MKKLIDDLVEKHWREYEKDVISAGFPWSTRIEINNEVNAWVEGIKGEYDASEYQSDSDEYVKFVARLDILKMIAEDIARYASHDYPTPKRFYQAHGPRD